MTHEFKFPTSPVPVDPGLVREGDEPTDDSIVQKARTRALQALLRRAPELAERHAYKLLTVAVARFGEGAAQLGEDEMAGFYAYLTRDARLEEAFVALLAAARVPDEFIPPPPHDLTKRIARAEERLRPDRSTMERASSPFPVWATMRAVLEQLFPRPVLAAALADTTPQPAGHPHCQVLQRDALGQLTESGLTAEVRRAEIDRVGRLRIEVELIGAFDAWVGHALQVELAPDVIASRPIRTNRLLFERRLPAEALPQTLRSSQSGQWFSLLSAVCQEFQFVLTASPDDAPQDTPDTDHASG